MNKRIHHPHIFPAVKLGGMALTPKQEAFALAYVETGNASEAYRRSYDVDPNCQPQTIWVNSCQLLADTKVSLRVFELQQEAKERTLVTVESITKEYEEVRQMAVSSGDLAPANTAIMGKAKVNGLMVENLKVSGLDELAARIARASSRE